MRGPGRVQQVIERLRSEVEGDRVLILCDELEAALAEQDPQPALSLGRASERLLEVAKFLEASAKVPYCEDAHHEHGLYLRDLAKNLGGLEEERDELRRLFEAELRGHATACRQVEEFRRHTTTNAVFDAICDNAELRIRAEKAEAALENLGDGGQGEAGLRGALEAEVEWLREIGEQSEEDALGSGPAAQKTLGAIAASADRFRGRLQTILDANPATQPVPSCLSEEAVREKLLGEEGFKAVLDNWPAAHLPHKVKLDEFDGLDDPKLKEACAEAEGLNRDAADEILRAILDVLLPDTALSASSDTEGADR